MARIQTRCPDHFKDEFEAFCDQHYKSQAEVIRQGIITYMSLFKDTRKDYDNSTEMSSPSIASGGDAVGLPDFDDSK